MESKQPVTDTAMLGQLADLIRDARNLSKRVPAKEAAELGKLLERAHGLLNQMLQHHGEAARKLD